MHYKYPQCFNHKSGLLVQQYFVRVTKFVTQLYTQVQQIFIADQVLRDDPTLVHNTCIVFQCYMPQLYSTLKKFPSMPQVEFQSYCASICCMELCGECMLDLCTVAIQNTRLVVIYYAHAAVLMRMQYLNYCMLLQVQVVNFSLFVIVNNACTQGRYNAS